MNKKIESILNRIEKNNGKRITLRRDTLVKMAQEQLFTYMDSYSYNDYSGDNTSKGITGDFTASCKSCASSSVGFCFVSKKDNTLHFSCGVHSNKSFDLYIELENNTESIYKLSNKELNTTIDNIVDSMRDEHITNIDIVGNTIECTYISKYQTKCTTGLYAASEGIKNAQDLQQVHDKLIEIYNPSNYTINSETTDKDILQTELNTLESRINKIDDIISTCQDDERKRLIYRDLQNKLKYEYSATMDILNNIKDETIEVVETKEESVIIEDTKIESNTTTLEDTIIEDVKIVLNQDKNGVELYFNNKPDEDVRNNMKANGFFWNRKKLCWNAKQSETTLNFAKSLNNKTPEDIKEISEEYKENRELELNNKLNELNIDDIENYIVPEEISKRENDNSFFRNKPINHTQQLQNTLSNANNEVIEVLQNNTNISIEYNLKMSLQRFKRDYTEATIKYLNTKANNPSWMVTGRDGRNARKDSKMNDRQTNQMFKLNEVLEKFNKSISAAKNQIRKEKSDLLKQEIKESLDTVKELPKFKRIKKEIKTTFGSYNKMVYEYNNYSIFKDCATWSVYSPEGKQIYKSLTTGTLEECKKWLIYNLNNAS